MKNRWFVVLPLYVTAAFAANASEHPKQQLKALFERAEQSYLTDDFEQLMSCKEKYSKLFYDSGNLLGDSLDVYLAYYYKICGAYYYEKTEEKGYLSGESENYYKKSLKIFDRRHSDKNIITLREELAQLYYKIKNYDAALQQLDTIYQYYDDHLNNLGISLYEPDYYRTLSQLAICHARLGNYELALKQIEEAQKYFKKQKSEFYYETLRREGKIRMLQADSLGTTHYKEARRCYERYVDEEFNSIVQRLDTMNSARRAQHWLATHKFLYDCYRLGNHAPEMLYDLALFSKGFLISYENDSRTQEVRWEKVRKKLTNNDCAIEFVQYFGRNDEKRIGCLVLKKNTKPKFIDLFATDSLLSLELKESYTVGEAFNASKPEMKDTLYRDTRLRQLIWSRQLMEAIGEAKNIFFAPDGMIHQWAIEYIIPDSQKVCFRLSSTRNLALRRSVNRVQSALLCGGITYGASYQPTKQDNDSLAYRFLKPRIKLVKDLPNTRTEVDSIYACRHNSNDTLLKGDIATDERILTLLGKKHYDIVHFSTHGHYIGYVNIHNDLRPMTDDLSLSRCGMIFAGAANTFTDDHYDDSRNDALLSGAELSQLDFSKTELVVLNACQTGQGRLTDDGVFGLQRAIKQAGASTMMVSLWNLYDDSSARYLRYFYEELEKQKAGNISFHRAFLSARKRMMEYERNRLTFDETTLGFRYVKDTYRSPRHVDPLILIDAF